MYRCLRVRVHSGSGCAGLWVRAGGAQPHPCPPRAYGPHGEVCSLGKRPSNSVLYNTFWDPEEWEGRWRKATQTGREQWFDPGEKGLDEKDMKG